MLVEDWVEALGIGGPYPALVFSGLLPCADGGGELSGSSQPALGFACRSNLDEIVIY